MVVKKSLIWYYTNGKLELYSIWQRMEKKSLIKLICSINLKKYEISILFFCIENYLESKCILKHS